MTLTSWLCEEPKLQPAGALVLPGGQRRAAFCCAHGRWVGLRGNDMLAHLRSAAGLLFFRLRWSIRRIGCPNSRVWMAGGFLSCYLCCKEGKGG